MPMHAELNSMELCPKFSELDRPCPVEFILMSLIIPFMFLVAKTKGTRHGLKGQGVLVSTGWKKKFRPFYLMKST